MEHKKDKDDAILTPSTKDHPKNFSHDSGHHKFIQWKKSFRIKCQDVKRKEKNMYKGVIYSSGQKQVLILLV